MKKVSKTLAIVLCLVMIISLTALADWTQYQKDGNHNGVIDTAPYITNLSGGSIPLNSAHLGTIQLGSGGWSGIDSEPLMLTEDTVTYAYVTYNGGTVSGDQGGTRLAKINVTTTDNSGNVKPTKVWDIQLTLSSGFQLSTPVYYNENIYVSGSGLSQLLLNNELVKNGNSYDHWSITGGIQNNGYVSIRGNRSATFVSDFTSINSGNNHRPAVGIKLGTTAPSYTTATITVYAIDTSNVQTLLHTYVFSPNAASSSYRPILNADDNNYYYYLNHNLTSTENAILNGSSYQFKYVVSITNSDSSSNTVDVDYCSFFEQNSSVFEVSDITNTTAPSYHAIAKIGSNGGQINTPITGYDYIEEADDEEEDVTHKCIYFGTYGGTHSYYQYDITTDTLKTFTPSATTGGFYWAGAYSDGTYVVFGGDGDSNNGNNGYLYCTTAADFGNLLTSQQYALNSLVSPNLTDAGNVRSTICYYDGYYYFTSQGGSSTSYLWKVNAANIANLGNTDVSYKILQGNSSTSTPVISDNERLYVGYYNGFTSGGIEIVDVNNFSNASAYYSVDPVQSSIIVYSSGTIDYIFFTTNAASGAGYCYSYDGTNFTKLWQTPGATYALQGMSSANGYLAFGNDGHVFYVVKY